MNLIEELKRSKNVFLKSEGESIEKWKKLPHNKEGMDLFLEFNIAEINYDGKQYFCTSNVGIVERLNPDKNISKLMFMSFRDLSLTWNLIENKLISFSMKKNWSIVNFISITPSNVEILNTAINRMLERQANKDLML